VVDLNSYPTAFFYAVQAFGIYLVRRQRKALAVPEPSKGHRFHAWHVAIIFTILVNVYMLIMPWYPPPGGATGGDVRFWYATYVVTGIGILIACAAYWGVWVHLLPKWKGYRVRHERLVLDGGEVTHRLVKIPLKDLEKWDEEHDGQGQRISGHRVSGSDCDVVDVKESIEGKY
jgi:hypothetical protein